MDDPETCHGINKAILAGGFQVCANEAIAQPRLLNARSAQKVFGSLDEEVVSGS